jgi:hypothetical protein
VGSVCCADLGKAHELVTLNVNFVHNLAVVAVDHIAVVFNDLLVPGTDVMFNNRIFAYFLGNAQVRHSVVLSVLLFCSRNYIMQFVVNTKHVVLLTVATVRTAPSLQLIAALASTSVYAIAISTCFFVASCYYLASASKFYATCVVTTVWAFVTPRLCNMAGWVRASRAAASEFLFTHIVLRPATSSRAEKKKPPDS